MGLSKQVFQENPLFIVVVIVIIIILLIIIIILLLIIIIILLKILLLLLLLLIPLNIIVRILILILILILIRIRIRILIILGENRGIIGSFPFGHFPGRQLQASASRIEGLAEAAAPLHRCLAGVARGWGCWWNRWQLGWLVLGIPGITTNSYI